MYGSSFEAINRTRQSYLSPIEKVSNNHYFRPDIVAQAQNFDINSHFANLKGPAVEVGGPTSKYHILLGEDPPKDMLVTNISNNTFWGKDDTVSLLGDASHLPFADGTLGSLFSSYLPQTGYTKVGEVFDLRQSFFREATRTLEPDGLLVIQGTTEDQLTYANSLGLTPVRIMETEGSLPLTGEYTQWDAILMKTAGEPGFSYSAEAISMPTVEIAPALGTAAMDGTGVGFLSE